jgi:hypothetical protein
MAEIRVMVRQGLKTRAISLIHTPLHAMQAMATALGFQQATDGVWVPVCDLRQYEGRLHTSRAIAASEGQE